MLQAENYLDAARVLGEAVRLEPANAEAQYYFGVASLRIGEFAQAEKALKESLRLNKRNADAHNVLGLIYNQTGDKQHALEEYRQALADPNYRAKEQTHLNMALCLDDMGKTEEAITSLRHAVEANPRYYPAHYELAKLLDRQDQTREAIEEYEVAAPEYAADPNYHYRLGLAYFRDKKPDRAREHLSKVIAAMPGSEKALKAKEYLELMEAPSKASPGSDGRSGHP
jgi:tetratricopeptide (TPR) repeat protein